MKKKSLDRHLNVLKHAFINFIFVKLELSWIWLCTRHLIMH